MEILTSKLHSIELNIINSKIQCLNREISLILRRFYNHQINKSQNTLRKINCNLNINLSLIRLSRHINNNSNAHLHYLHKNISMSLRLLKNKVYTGFTNNLIFKLNTLQRVVYYKKDIMYTKIRGTVVYREKKERLKRKIEVILKRLGERMMKGSEKYMKESEKRNESISLIDKDKKDASYLDHRDASYLDHRDASYLDHDSINEGYCTVNVYDSSSIDLEIGEAICTVNTITELHCFKEGSCEVENYTNINNEVWSNKVCNVSKKYSGKDDEKNIEKHERKAKSKVVNHYGFTGNEPNNYLSKLKDNHGDEIRFKDTIVEESKLRDEIDFKDEIVEESKLRDDINFKDELVEESKLKDGIDFKDTIVEESKAKDGLDFKDTIVEESKAKDGIDFKDTIVEESKSKDVKKVDTGCQHESKQDINIKQGFDTKICTVNTLLSGLVEESNYNRISFYHTIITSSLARLNKKIVSKLYISLQDLYIDILKLKILLTLKQFQYNLNGQKYNSGKKPDNSKLTYISEKGNLESDKRFLEMINETLQDIEKYRDPIVIRMGIQFILAKRYVEDIIYLKE